MSTTRLLERIREMERNPDWRGDVDPEQLIESILNHLKEILNTRQGAAENSEDFDIPDFSMVTLALGQSKTPDIERCLGEVIARYERRLRNSSVYRRVDDKDPMGMFFVVEGELVSSREPYPVQFEILLSSTGHVVVNRCNVTK